MLCFAYKHDTKLNREYITKIIEKSVKIENRNVSYVIREVKI